MKHRMISGIKPTNYSPTLGNYIGAIKPFINYQDTYELYVFVADLHALTIYNNPGDLKKSIENLTAIYLAAGLDPNKCTIFKQSDIYAHNQLEWVLTCNTCLSDLTKMPQFKNYQNKHVGEAVPSGMLLYTSLMNSDILLYDVDYVPVGADQKPHVDLTRDVAERFNKIYGSTFKLPEPVLAPLGAKIMSLTDPTKKMSKSEGDKGTIYLLEDVEITRKKIMRAVTDGEGKIYYDPVHKPGISNLITIYASLSNQTIAEVEALYKDVSDYGKFKRDVADVVCAELSALQLKVIQIKQSSAINKVLHQGACKAQALANEKINTVYERIGLR